MTTEDKNKRVLSSSVRFPVDRDSLERDCSVEFIIAGGPGGQHRNRRETGVRLVHNPSGTTVLATERRSQYRNLETAFERMAERLRAMNRRPKPRKATRPSRGAVKRRLTSKKQRSQTKQNRRKPGTDD